MGLYKIGTTHFGVGNDIHESLELVLPPSSYGLLHAPWSQTTLAHHWPAPTTTICRWYQPIVVSHSLCRRQKHRSRVLLDGFGLLLGADA